MMNDDYSNFPWRILTETLLYWFDDPRMGHASTDLFWAQLFSVHKYIMRIMYFKNNVFVCMNVCMYVPESKME